jgi:SsrA-binding protein
MSNTPHIVNRKARYEYGIGDEIEAGMMLTGSEVKSLRTHGANLNDAYAGEKDGKIWLFNAYIAEFHGANRFNHDTRRPRLLLLHKREIAKLLGKIKTKGVTLVPLSIYFNERGYAKIKIGVATGKKSYEKRDAIKEREWQREKSRTLKDQW